MSWEEAYRYQREGDYARALEIFRRLRSDGSLQERAALEIGKTYKMMNRPAEAIDVLAAVLSGNPRNDEALGELAETCRLSQRFDTACGILERIAPINRNAYLELGRIFLAQGDLDAASAHLRAFSDEGGDGPAVHVGYGKIYRGRGEHDRAAEEFRKALAASPDDYEACFEMGELLRQRGDLRLAADYYARAAAVRGDKAAHLRLVEMYALLGEREKSDRAAADALRLTPQRPFDQDDMRNEIEILQRKVVLSSKVKRLWVTLTSRCNIRCKTCGLWRNIWDLPYSAAREIMDHYPYLQRVVWFGGEVFLYEHFEELFDEAARFANLKQQVITNGYRLTERWIDKIVTAPNAELTFSVDGTTKEVYEAIRQGSNFENVVENIRRVMRKKKECGSAIDVRLNAVIMRSNWHQLESFVEFAHREGFNQVSLMALHFAAAPEEDIFYGGGDRAAAKTVSEAMPRLKERARRCGIELDILLPPAEKDFHQAARQAVPGAGGECSRASASHGLSCTMPWRYMMLCDSGDVVLTGSCTRVIGNISRNSLDEIWNSETAQLYRRCMIERRFEGICRRECLSRW